MKEITYFYLAGCPFCSQADRIIGELKAEDPRFADIKITKVEERKNADMADCYDYYYVPCLWQGEKKLHEGAPTKEKIKKAFLAVLEEKSDLKV